MMTRSRNELEKELRATRTVYAFRPRVTEQIYRSLLSNHVDILEDRHREAWTKKQDEYHQSFFRTWERAVREQTKLELPFDSLKHRYPTAGSSEAIREVLAHLGSYASARDRGTPTIHIFQGEYEGYKALAEPYGIRVIEHKRLNWRSELAGITYDTKGHVFFLSQPSSIDGNIWEDFDPFLNFLAENTHIQVALDLCYVGGVPLQKWFTDPQAQQGLRFSSNLSPEARDRIAYIFFSLSKVYGVYYNRIGGVYSRDPIPGLWGNMWFKNLDSLYFGETLIQSLGMFTIPRLLHNVQKLAVVLLSQELGAGTRVTPSDVILLAHQQHFDVGRHCNLEPDEFANFSRTPVHLEGSNLKGDFRFCLTPLLSDILHRVG